MFKKIVFACLSFLVYGVASAQNDSIKKAPEGLKEDWTFRVYLVYPIQFGDHSLADAHSANPGLGLTLGAFSYRNFSLFAGCEFLQYKVTDYTKIGNIDRTNYSAFFGTIVYKLPVSKKIELYPDLGLGYVVLKQRGDGRKFGHQDGTEFRIGFTANYRVSKKTSFFIGAHYIYNTFEIATNEAYQDYFGKANQIQVSAGIQLD